jgi:hypothetical protein
MFSHQIGGPPSIALNVFLNPGSQNFLRGGVNKSHCQSPLQDCELLPIEEGPRPTIQSGAGVLLLRSVASCDEKSRSALVLETGAWGCHLQSVTRPNCSGDAWRVVLAQAAFLSRAGHPQPGGPPSLHEKLLG